MKELENHKIRELLKDKYSRICLDYVILSADEEYEGAASHKNALLTAFEILRGRDDFQECDITVDESKISAEMVSTEKMFELPPENFRKNPNHTVPSPLPYWYAFLYPPHGTPYSEKDFVMFNEILFPNKKDLETYKWCDSFSNYFDAGKEWWGTGMWTVFDLKSKTFVVIGASLTD